MVFLKNNFKLEKSIWICILIYTLLPFVTIAFFNLPMGDDLYFGQVGRDKTTFGAVSFWYNNWGGRYTQELFLTILNPATYGSLRFFWLPPLFIIFSISTSFFVLLKSISNPQVSSKDLLILFSALLFLVFNLMPQIGETIYWISGAYTFQTGNVFLVLLIAIIINLFKNNSSLKTLVLIVLAAVLIMLIAGTNEVSMAYMFGFSILFLIHQRKAKTNLILIWIFLFLIVCLATYISITAPGNLVRAKETGGVFQNFPKAIVESIIRGFFYLLFWLPSAILVTVMCWKQIGKIAKKHMTSREVKLNERRIVFSLFLIIIFAGFFPSLISTGWNAPRTVAPIFIVFLILYFGIIIYYYSYLTSLISKLSPNKNSFSGLLLLVLLIGFSNKHNIMNAYIDIVSLRVVNYNNQISKTYEEMQSSDRDTIYVLPLYAKPNTLPIRWPEHYNRLVNDELEKYFHKKIVMKSNFK
ncbi:DUF6056 family protein [Flavobacterium sp.]|uniref:DUF6056 family protein n=1 Tax=Flavobacterium sp. TaxID=239 RepID=UPI00286EA106|nr:DUF6056 family protein [Flavobacterium sp.]